MNNPAPDYRQHLEIETPEHVVLDYEIAGIGSRTLAALVDWALVAGLVILVIAGSSFLRYLTRTSWSTAILTILLYLITAAYFAFFEGVYRGQTPGKRMVGIRVIRDTGHAITMTEAVARNLMNLPDMAIVGVFMIALHPRGKRLGDLIAGTVVVRDKPVTVATPSLSDRLLKRSATTSEDVDLAAPVLNDAEFHLLAEFMRRSPDLPVETRTRLASGLADRFADRVPGNISEGIAFLAELHAEERARRQGRIGALVGRGGSTGQRLAARKAARWEEFHLLATRVTQEGLDGLSARELPEFAARYREVAADLARAKTYHAEAAVQLRLERLVAAGHNALYHSERRTWHSVWRFIAVECPATVVQQRRTVLLAFVIFATPAVAGYATLRSRPDLAEQVIPDGMRERAEAGKDRTRTGRGYINAAGEERPGIASRIIVNNIRVSLFTFFSGIFLGIGSLIVLAMNGLQLGGVSGYYHNVGMLGYLWTFVAGHGVLELFAIWVAGAAGFRLGFAVITPGNLSRSDALALAGRNSMRMIGAVVTLLLIAGSIEGMISAADYGLRTQITVSACSLVFLIMYLSYGALAAARAGHSIPTSVTLRS